MLDRYKKPGGFVQLLTLLETCGPQKQVKFLEIIRAEDALWAEAIKQKMLDIHRIFSWPQEAISEVAGTLQDLTLAVAMHGLSVQENEKIRKTFSHARTRKIDGLFATNNPTPNEVSSMYERILVEVRKMITDGHLRVENFDPALDIPDEFEEVLAHGNWDPGKPLHSDDSDHSADHGVVLNFDLAETHSKHDSEHGHGSGHSSGHGSGATDLAKMELSTLRKRAQDLEKQNAMLRHEVQVLKTKLEQIKKMVA